MKRLAVVPLTLLSLGWVPGLLGQTGDLIELRREIGLLNEVLAEALELNQASGLFGIGTGGIDSIYLDGQGIVLEVRSPLANRRNRLSLASLNSAIQALPQNNPFAGIRTGPTRADTVEQAAEAIAAPSDAVSQELLARLAEIDFSLIANTALQQASSAARSLRSLGELDATGYGQLLEQIAAQRDRVEDGLGALRQLQLEIGAVSRQPGAAESVDRLSARVDELLTVLQGLRSELVEAARSLNEQSEQARRRYAEAWRQELADLERSLYRALCDFGASLRSLPAGERVSIVLVGLGEDLGDGRRTDKVHIVKKSDLQGCRAGELETGMLRERSSEYSY